MDKTHPGEAGIKLNIDDLWYRWALSFLLKSIVFIFLMRQGSMAGQFQSNISPMDP